MRAAKTLTPWSTDPMVDRKNSDPMLDRKNSDPMTNGSEHHGTHRTNTHHDYTAPATNSQQRITYGPT